MIVQVRLFARARDLVQCDCVRVELPDHATVADLRYRLAADYPKLAGLLERSALAVENEFAAEDLLLPANAEVALLPPVSGGECDNVPYNNRGYNPFGERSYGAATMDEGGSGTSGNFDTYCDSPSRRERRY